MSDPDQYKDMNAGAHRRPSPQIAAPALMWHQGFWCPSRAENANIPGVKFDDRTWQYKVDLFLYQLFLALHKTCRNPRFEGGESDDFVCPNYDRDGKNKTLNLFWHRVVGYSPESFSRANLERLKPKDRSVRHDVFAFRGSLYGLSLVVNARLHHEYFTITFALDFSDKLNGLDAPSFSPTFPPDLKDIATAFWDAHDLIIERYEHYTANLAEDLNSKQLPKADNFYPKATNAFRQWATMYCGEATRGEAVKLDSCGALFADFCGAAFALRPDRGAGNSLEWSTVAKTRDHNLTISKQVIGVDVKVPALSLRLIDAAWPVIRRFSSHYRKEQFYGKPEYTVSTLQDGFALYVSSLGHLLPESVADDREPVNYLLFVTYPSKWRLGRLIDRLHTLGILRLAALRDLEQLNTASTDISVWSRDIREIGNDDPVETEWIIRKVRDVGRDIEGGLMYRIFRSRYYVTSFKENVEMLGAGRVSGFPPYKNFVNRRIYDAFDYVDRIGTRYGELQREALFALNASHRVAMEENTRATSSLLATGEIISFIPIAYYTGSILFYCLEGSTYQTVFGRIKYPTEHLPYFCFGLLVGVAVAFFGRHVIEFFSKKFSRVYRLIWKRLTSSRRA